MATLIRLSGVTTDNETLPSLADYGSQPQTGLIDSIKMTADITANSVAGGAAMTDQSTATGGNVATWADGIATLPDLSGTGEYHRFQMTNDYASLNRTLAVIYRVPDTSRSQTLFGVSNGFNLLSSDSLTLNFNDGANQNVDVGSVTANVWNSVIVTEDDTGLRLVHNGGAIQAVNWADYAATPATTNVTIFGRNSETFSPYGEFAFLSAHNVALSDADLANYAAGLAAFAAGVKGITIGG
ncbi:hypothetical protein SAMN05216376_10543 [Mameliella alba]|uniref:hypothetical protein n=1 Tax=Mameliella alba TaxID=561184 RepID=UPI00087EA724|nr:hypothetical protein [Mameliella alba]OWV48107.1 hypothetical protein CDZ96_09790 [Mameliella alba]PTR40137.1 hypothetical protein LX94_01616 [Mameliella alba]GGF42548.1 hypothetical protein GCM10011319_00430 [Mameliella alba]SDC93588.1 hypothetical protein SAMN05216376_10543 [Mameliella alba]